MRKQGFTLMELMVVAGILIVVFGSLFKLLTSGQKNAAKVMSALRINDEIQTAVDYISDDVREANLIVDPDSSSGNNCPPIIQINGGTPMEDQVKAKITDHTLKPDDPKNRIILVKCTPIAPNQVSETPKGIFKIQRVIYYLDKDPTAPTIYALVRTTQEMKPDGTPLNGTISKKILIDDINISRDYLVFFRTKGADGALSARNIYFAADLFRKEKGTGDNPNTDGKAMYHGSVISSAHIRGAAPEFLSEASFTPPAPTS